MSPLHMRNSFAILLFILSIVMLIPGITQPLLSISATIEKQQMLEIAKQSLLTPGKASGFVENIIRSVVEQMHVEGTLQLFDSTRSLWDTMHQLITHGHVFTGLLISLFGVIIPVFKILLNMIALLSKSPKLTAWVLAFSSLISKWSMSDVFVMALILVFLSINANEQAINAVQMHAKLEAGFYYFATYCILAIAAAQLMQPRKNTAD